jgi:hypothetical protein
MAPSGKPFRERWIGGALKAALDAWRKSAGGL